MKTERRKFTEAAKPRLIVVPETEPYVRNEPAAPSEHDRPTVRRRPIDVGEREATAPESVGRYSHVYGRSSPKKRRD